MNVGDLYNEVKKRWPEETPILTFQFWPRNSHVKSASVYTGTCSPAQIATRGYALRVCAFSI